MTDQETSVANFFETTLTVEMSDTDLTATVGSTTGLTSPTFLVIEPDSASQREVILFDGSFTGTTFVTSTIANRYLSGSAAGSGLTHPVGAIVRSAPLAQHLDDIHDRVDADAAVVSSHVADSDAHHAQSHAHDGVDGSGTVAHSDTTGQGTDDHHAEDHAARHADGGADALPAGAVGNTQLATDAVTPIKIADFAVSNSKIGTGAVTTSKIQDFAVQEAKLGTGSVATAKIADDAVTGAKASDTFFQDFEVDDSTEVASQALTGSMADVASVTLSIPSGWGSWKCEAWASYASDPTGVMTYGVRIRIDGTSQQEKTVNSSGGGHDGAVGGRRTGITTTGSRTVAFQGREISGDTTLTDVYLYARAVRTG